MRFFRPQLMLAIWGTLTLLWFPFAEYAYAYLHIRDRESHEVVIVMISSVFVLSFYLAAVVSIISLVLLIIRRSKLFAFRSLVCTVAYVVVFILAVQISYRVRMCGYLSVVSQSQSLIKAIAEYSTKYGRAPVALEVLVPEFIPSIPSTDLGGSREYEYRQLTGQWADSYDNNPWMLTVHVGSGLRFDELIYFPKQNYQKLGNLERVGEWALSRD